MLRALGLALKALLVQTWRFVSNMLTSLAKVATETATHIMPAIDRYD